MHIGYFDSGLINIEQKCKKKLWNIEKCLEQNMSNYGSSWNSTLLGEVKRPKSVHYILSITRPYAVAMWECYQENILSYDGYNTQGT